MHIPASRVFSVVGELSGLAIGAVRAACLVSATIWDGGEGLSPHRHIPTVTEENGIKSGFYEIPS